MSSILYGLMHYEDGHRATIRAQAARLWGYSAASSSTLSKGSPKFFTHCAAQRATLELSVRPPGRSVWSLNPSPLVALSANLTSFCPGGLRHGARRHSLPACPPQRRGCGLFRYLTGFPASQGLNMVRQMNSDLDEGIQIKAGHTDRVCCD